MLSSTSALPRTSSLEAARKTQPCINLLARVSNGTFNAEVSHGSSNAGLSQRSQTREVKAKVFNKIFFVFLNTDSVF